MSTLYQIIMDDYGPPLQQNPFTSDERASISKMLPGTAAEFCISMGRAVMRDGVVQSCHPDDLRGVLALVFGADKDFSHKNCFAFAYTAFGTISFWKEGYGTGEISLYDGQVSHDNFVNAEKASEGDNNTVTVPFSLPLEALDYPDKAGKDLFKRATKKLGPIEIGQCFGFVPVLPLGGTPDLAHLKRLSAPEHFAIVSQSMEYLLVESEDFGDITEIRPIGPR
jgi:hypothetical protein